MWQAMSDAGRKRIENHYQQSTVISAYRNLYGKYLYANAPAHAGRGGQVGQR
jgi:hypothetical protein